MTAFLANRAETFASPEEGLAAELALLNAVVEGRASRGTLAWQTTPSLVVPYQATRKAGFAGAALRSALKGRPVAYRRTGGTATPQGPGILNLAAAFVARPGMTASDAYLDICDAIIRAFGRTGIEAQIGPCDGSFCDGAFNVLVDGKKIVGTAQRWRRLGRGHGQAILVHALILVDVPLDDTITAVAEFERDLAGVTGIRGDAHSSVVLSGAEAPVVTKHLVSELRRVGARAAENGPTLSTRHREPSRVGVREAKREASPI